MNNLINGFVVIFRLTYESYKNCVNIAVNEITLIMNEITLDSEFKL